MLSLSQINEAYNSGSLIIKVSAYKPLWDNKSRHLHLMGGAGSGKSVFAAQKIVNRARNEVLLGGHHKFVCLRKVARTIKESIFDELRKATMPYREEVSTNRSNYSFTFANGNQIVCVGLDEPEKIKSISGVTGIWVEEATEFTEEDLDQLNIRLRGTIKLIDQKSYTYNGETNYKQIIYSYNPIREDHFLKSKFWDVQRDDATCLKTTYKDNPFLDAQDREQLEQLKDTNPLYYEVYCLGNWGVVDKSNKFLWAFDHDKHVGECFEEPELPIGFSFDFNIEPFTVTVFQRKEPDTLHVIDYIRMNNSDIYAVCDRIREKYHGRFWYVTGDASGYNRQGAVRGTTNYWKVIMSELRLSSAQVKVPKRNLDHNQSKVICNAALQTQQILIHPKCEHLINDCKYAKVDEFGKLIKDRDENKNDFLDNFRYMMHEEFFSILKYKR